LTWWDGMGVRESRFSLSLSLFLSFFHYPTWNILIDHLRIAREYSSPSIWLPASSPSSSSSIY
jgi:hypothetical protein